MLAATQLMADGVFDAQEAHFDAHVRTR